MEVEGARYMYSLLEQIFLVANYYRLDADYRAICVAFTEQFPNSPVPTYRNINKLHTKFQRINSVVDAPRSGRPHSVRTEENKIRVAQMYVENWDSRQNEHLFSWIYHGVHSTALCTSLVSGFRNLQI